MSQILLVIHLIAASAVIGLVLIQHGKGAEAGATLGGGTGASSTMFGSAGTSNFLSKTTAIFVTIFFVTSLSLGYLSKQPTTENIDSLIAKTQNKTQEIPE